MLGYEYSDYEDDENSMTYKEKLRECIITLNKIITCYHIDPHKNWSTIDFVDLAKECLRKISDE